MQYIWPKDPEDKFGPIGYDPPGTPPGSEMRYLAIEDAMDYRVEIWNHEDAQVAAQDVMIEDTLDPDLFDLSTLEFTRFGFLRWDVPLPGGQAIDARVDMRPDMNLVVDVTASLDPETGKIEWWFHSMDPMTGDYPEDPRAGFLPPFNPETGYELGWVEFRVKPRADLPSGTRIENRAYGEFDFMGDRYNNPAPPDGPWINTIDAGIPDDASRVSPLPPATTETSFLVRWSGQDEPNGSGIGAYDIYVSIDDGPFDPWLESTPESSAVWTGESGHKYSFYSVATDNVGHREPTPLVPDTEIIIAGAWHNATNPYDVNAQDGVTPLDVLTLINYINSHPGDFSLPNPPDSPPPPPPFYDVNDDNLCSPLDVLLVINYINSKSRATIEVTDVPPYGVDGFVSGRVTGVDFSTHRVAPYIQIEGSGWWTKPTAETRAVPINPDGTFTADVATGGIDNRATIFCAALVADEINPPLALGDSRIPASLESMVLDCRERYARTIEFAGYTWGVKESPIPVGPNANRFSDDATDVFVDQQGLHLTVNLNDQNPQDEYWSATEVILLDRLGYGTYSFQTNSRLDELDPNVTFGAFTWDSYGDDQSGASPDREIDFEDSRWGNPNDPTNAQMVVQPFGTPGNLERYTIPDLSEDPALTRFFTWQPGQIKFVALRGHHTPADFPEADVIHRWVYVEDPGANHFVPTEGRESFRFNLWLNSGSAPANGQPVEVVITDFRYTRLTAAASAEGELPLESINRFLPLTQVGHAQPPAVQGASASLRAATDVPRTNYAEPIPLEDMDLRVVSRDQRTVRQSLTYGFGESDAELTYLDTVLPDIVGDIASVWRQL